MHGELPTCLAQLEVPYLRYLLYFPMLEEATEEQ